MFRWVGIVHGFAIQKQKATQESSILVPVSARPTKYCETLGAAAMKTKSQPVLRLSIVTETFSQSIHDSQPICKSVRFLEQVPQF
jgi:hypothetical protein